MASRRFAEDTSVPVERSRAEIEALLRRNGAEGFAFSWSHKEDMIGFQWRGHKIKFTLPAINDDKVRSIARREQLNRSRWRALLLVIKAKLEAVHAGIAIFEEEFLAYVVTQDGTTVGEHLVPQLRGGQLSLPPAKGQP
jgi:hypothetical protein